MGRLTQLFSKTLASLRRLWFCYGDAHGYPRASHTYGWVGPGPNGERDAYAYPDGDAYAYGQTVGYARGQTVGYAGGYARGQTSEGGWIVSEKEDDEATEAVNKRGPGRPRKQLSVEEEEQRKMKNRQRNRDYRKNKKGKFNHLQKEEELFKEFCEERGITEEFKAFCEKRNLGSELAEKGKISKDALPSTSQLIHAVTLGCNLMKEQLQSMHIGSEFLDLSVSDIIQRHPSLQSKLMEGLSLIGQGHAIYDEVAMQSDNPPVLVPRSFFLLYEGLESELLKSNVFPPLGDATNIAANSPQFQAVNAIVNNVEQEDDANDQRMDEATEADN